MELLETILITLQFSNVLSKRYGSSSEESIENLIYYKDCNHKRKEDVTAPSIRSQPQPTQECKMCCSMCCGDECTHTQHEPMMSRQSPAMMKPPPFRQPVPQPTLNQRAKRPKMRQVPGLQPPLANRRNIEFTRQHIRSLISQDQDIRKILKDLVRVTMQKVDLMDMIKTRRSLNNVEGVENSEGEYQQ
ncbi:PREDICTED: uncharacterized protein LOC106117345 [Papilio xuthus]|uniref:Uncharacterized protein LOC106117345 n=1 Tax=Papilio xuthus TaxID=66420 RepID=A0AAJ7E8H9_PAPXU|nr:PREDICTED: uncharacterized protein LOC106117345 [Papilio xuthus]